MTAQILQFPGKRTVRTAAASGAPRFVTNFVDLLTFQMPSPMWCGPDSVECRFTLDDGARIQEFFRWLGVEVAVDRNHESLVQGVAYLQEDICASAAWSVEQEQSSVSQRNRWIYSWQIRYFDAIVSGDWAGATEHLRQTPYWPVLQVKMETPLGTALK